MAKPYKPLEPLLATITLLFNHALRGIWIAEGINKTRVTKCETRGQWPVSTRAMRNKLVMLFDFNYFCIHVYIAYNSHLCGLWGHGSLQMVSMAWEVKFDLRFDLKSATSTTLVSLWMFPLTAIWVASEAMTPSKQTQWHERSNLT